MARWTTLAAAAAAAVAFCFVGCDNDPGFQPPVALPEGPPAQVGQSLMVCDFEDAALWKSENNSPFAAGPKHATQGHNAFTVHYTNKPEWSNIHIAKPPVSDWGNLRYLSVDIFLEGDAAVEFGMWIRDAAMHKAEASFTLGPGANTITLDLNDLATHYELDRTKVQAMCLYKLCPQEITVALDNMYVSEKPPVAEAAQPVRMADKELLSNTSFEELKKPDDLGNPFAWWLARRWQGQSFLGSGQKAVASGQHSAMLDGRGVCKIGFFSPPVKVQSPTRLRLSAMVAADGVKKGLYGSVAGITVTDAGERGLKNAGVDLPEGSYGWKKLDMVFDVPAKCPYVKVFIQSFGPGRLWVDDISLTGTDLDAKVGVVLTDAGKAVSPDGPIVTETPALLAKRAKVEEALTALKAAVAAGKDKGVETLYDEIPLKLAELALQARWNLPDHLKFREGNLDFVMGQASTATAHLKDVMDGKAPDLKVPPHPDFKKLTLKGRYFREGDEPRIIFSMQYHNSGDLLRWFSPRGYHGEIAAVGASRYDVQQTPVWEAYEKHPETHRVYDGGWCGHIICDQYSLGGSAKPCVISLESPKMREAIAKSIASRKVEPGSLLLNMGYEYSYVNFDAFSADLFCQWLEGKYVKIDALNAVWKTDLKSFAEVTLPDPIRPEPNPAKYYDFGDFNLWRFTDYMKWAKAQIAKVAPGLPVTTGGGEPFGSGFWRQGIDEEGLIRDGVNDVFLSETGSRALGVTSTMDLQRHLSDKPKLIIDPEYHAQPNTCFLMFLHGCGIMDYWWWPEEEGEFNDSSLKHSDKLSLEEVGVVMRTALDVRRLGRQIAAFPDAPAEIALLYSRASLVQKFPKAEGNKTPYTLEMEKTYEAAVRLDAPVGFISSRQVREGLAGHYTMIVIPGCRYVEQDVFAKLTDWVSAGGTLVVTPSSLAADEYNRKRDYLKTLGLELVSEELPELLAGEAKPGTQQTGELDFIQGPVVKTIVSKEPSRKITGRAPPVGEPLNGPLGGALGGLDAAGIIQTVKPSPDWKVGATYDADGSPAILWRPMGKGRIVYLAAQLTVDSRRAVLDRLMEQAKFLRPVRVAGPDSPYVPGVESRTVRQDDGWLTYIANTTGSPVQVKLSAAKPITEIDNLNRDIKEPTDVITLQPYETKILTIKQGG